MPLTKGDIVVTNISPTIQLAPDGEIVRMTNVEFKVRGFGPFSVQLPTEIFTASDIRPLIESRAREIVAVLEAGE